jgi:hypothetical protein
MSASTVDRTKPVPSASQEPCLGCDVPALCRNNYYRGKLLTERDFTDEQRYGIDKGRLHLQKLHGWGVVCGLVAMPHPNCPALRLVVSGGYAVDHCGREIRLLEDAYVPLPQPVPGTQTKKLKENREGGTDQHPTQRGEEGIEQDNGCDDAPPPKDYYLCIRYSECETEFAPAPFDDCSCTTSSKKPNRICEGYRLELTEQKPECWDDAKGDCCEAEDCCHYFREAQEGCGDHICCPCIPLAVLCDFAPGEPVRAEQIDNWRARRQLASTETLDKVVRCLLTKIPTEELTRIEYTNWEHNRRMTCREFLEEYIGSAENPKGFRIEFSHRVHSGSIDTRSLQAMVVFKPESDAEPRQMHIAPGKVEREQDETTWARLMIDPAYARRYLEGKDFDLFLMLKCGVIRDHHGHSVDGDFLGHMPTGDNIQGGLFESWIRVRARSRND